MWLYLYFVIILNIKSFIQQCANEYEVEIDTICTNCCDIFKYHNNNQCIDDLSSIGTAELVNEFYCAYKTCSELNKYDKGGICCFSDNDVNQNSSCQSECTPNYTLNANTNICECLEPNVLQDLDCQEQCDANYVNEDNICKLECSEGKFNEEGVCKDQCTIPPYLIEERDSKFYCVLECSNNFYKDGNYCVTQCSENKLIEDNQCVYSCSTNKPYIENNTCNSQCSLNKVSQDNICVDECLQGYITNNDSICVKCVYQNEICKLNCDSSYISNNENICILCKDNNMVNQRGKCQDICDNKYVSVNGECRRFRLTPFANKIPTIIYGDSFE